MDEHQGKGYDLSDIKKWQQKNADAKKKKEEKRKRKGWTKGGEMMVSEVADSAWRNPSGGDRPVFKTEDVKKK